MARILICALLALTLAGPAKAQSEDIQGVIRSQLDAFLADDFTTAFTFAAPNIKSIFRTPENFGLMVRQGYPMVWRPGDVTFLGLTDRAGQKVQQVLITDAAGDLHTLEYTLIETENGWQINGVRILPAPGLGA